MEYPRSRKIAGLVCRQRIRVCRAIGADGENAKSEAGAESEVSGAGGQDYRAATLGRAADQWNAADDRDAAAISGVSVLSDDVSAGVSEWGCVLSVRAAAEGGGEFVARRVTAEYFCAGEENLWGHSTVPGNLLFVWKCAVPLLRERFLGLGGGFHTVKE